MKNIRKKLLSLSLVAFFLFAPVSTVLASSTMREPIPPTTPAPVQDGDENLPIKERAARFLENVYEKSGKLIEHVGTDLARTENIEDRVTKAIERQNELGEDTSDIQAALDEFQAKIPAIENTYAEVVEIYENHAGFDDTGKVTDIDEGTDTIQSLKETLAQTHRDWHEAVAQLRDVLDAYRDAHPKETEN